MFTNPRRPTDPEGVPDAGLSRIEVVALVGVVVVGVVLRFVSASDLWLDEALSVNIASLGPDGIIDALRRDGHPPLYYLTLHGWMEVFGESDIAVRALSGVASLVTLALIWVQGTRRRGPVAGAYALAIASLLPFTVRYADEARMYALLMLLVAIGWVLVDTVLDDRGGWGAVAGIAVVATLMLYTHYWSLWLLAATGLAVIVGALRGRDPERRASCRRIAGALVVGGLAFVPWLPIMLDQIAHTGTPWGEPQRPSMSVAIALVDLTGGWVVTEAVLGSLVLGLLVVLALTARPRPPDRIELVLRTVPGIRPSLVTAAIALIIGICVTWVTGATFASRYASIVVPIVVVAAGLGLTTAPSRSIRMIAAGVTAILLLGASAAVVLEQRTQGGEVAAAVDARAVPGDVVVVCPDQLGPAFSRALEADIEVVTHPALTGPERVDWWDYAERNAAGDPQATAAEVLDRAGSSAVWVVWQGGYNTYESQCEALRDALEDSRSSEIVVESTPGEVFEPMWLERFAGS